MFFSPLRVKFSFKSERGLSFWGAGPELVGGGTVAGWGEGAWDLEPASVLLPSPTYTWLVLPGFVTDLF